VYRTEMHTGPPKQNLLHTVNMLCIGYYEACQRKNRANSWNDCHSPVGVPQQQAQKKICWDFVHALLELTAWLQAGEDCAIAAGSQADLKSGCPRLGSGVRRVSGRNPLKKVRACLVSYFLGPFSGGGGGGAQRTHAGGRTPARRPRGNT
jgi:hypothetical protein